MAIPRIVLCLVLLAGVHSASGQESTYPPGAPTPPRRTRPEPNDETRAQMEKDMAKEANKRREEQIKSDSEKLLKLATELKDYVDETDENMLSLNVVRKAEEIEKLAHNVKERMKGD